MHDSPPDQPDPPHDPTPRQALLMSRVLWLGLVGAEVLFGIAVVMLVMRGVVPEHPAWYPALVYVGAGALVVLTPLAYFARNQLYKAHWRGRAVTPRGYVMGNLVWLVLLQGATLVNLLAVLVIGRVMPTLLLAVLALVVQIVNYPHGRPMHAEGER